MSKNFRPFNLSKTFITHLDDVHIVSQTKQERFNLLEKYRQNLLKEYIKAAPDKSHFFLTLDATPIKYHKIFNERTEKSSLSSTL